jgi:hypothetical protein
LRFLEIVKGLTEKEISILIRSAMKYPPATRALLGAILDENKTTSTDILYNSLNPITKYKLTGASTVLSATEKWNIL